ncbi:MAG: phosphate/phosphite/phosphonate ABC transporter substrate-binding protein [Pseudomonadota bacterium]|nr:phosphate/phosphite/phosphonate ABC transporter substrate-binding protein [Pseudomonadota bacterium]
MELKRYLGLLAGLLLAIPALAQEDRSYTFGIVPQQPPSELAKLWTPFLSYLSEKTGYRLVFATSRGIGPFSERLYDGNYDFSYANPYHYTVAHDRVGYEAIAKRKNVSLRGILVVRADSNIADVSELDGQEIGFPSETAFAATLVTRAHFNKNNISVTPQYVNSHNAVYRGVINGRFPAGGGVMRTFNNLPEKERNKLKIFWTSDDYSAHAFMAHPGVPSEVVEKVQQAMIEMAKDEVGKRWLKRIKIPAIEAAGDSEWNDIRGLHLDEVLSN